MSEREKTVDERLHALVLKDIEEMEREAEEDEDEGEDWAGKHPYLVMLITVVVVLAVMWFMKRLVFGA